VFTDLALVLEQNALTSIVKDGHHCEKR